MLAGLIHLTTCRAAAALRARADAQGWAELIGQAIDRTGDAVILVFLTLGVCAALVFSAFVLWPVATAVTLGLGVRVVQLLVRKDRS